MHLTAKTLGPILAASGIAATQAVEQATGPNPGNIGAWLTSLGPWVGAALLWLWKESERQKREAAEGFILKLAAKSSGIEVAHE